MKRKHSAEDHPPAGGRSEGRTSSARRYELDWLRVFAVLSLLYFHTAAIFYQGELGEFYIKDTQSSRVMNLFITFVYQWHMPLFFFLSGAATWFALGFRTPGQYVAERFRRLCIPLVFGTLVLIPPQVYWHLASDPRWRGGSYLSFYPQFFNGIRPYGNFEWGHLWFIAYLFALSLVALPLLLYLRSEPGLSLRTKLTELMTRPGAILLLPALPLALIEGILRVRWPGFQNLYDDWANVLLYLSYFVYGYILSSEPRLGLAIDRHRVPALLLVFVTMAVVLGLYVADLIPTRSYTLPYISYQLLRGLNGWLWIVALLALGRRYLNFNHRLLEYTRKASYPFYLLHQTVVVAIGFYVVQWSAGVPAKFLIISTVSLVLTLIFYDGLVKRTRLTRLLFGIG